MYERFRWTRHSLVRNELTRQYEPMQPHLLMGFSKHFRCDMFLDIGANVGAYAVLMTACDSISEIHAFEPSPETFAEMAENIRLNGLAVEAHNAAVSDRPGILPFGIVNTFSGANSVLDTSIHTEFARQIEVPAVRLDDVLDIRGRRLCIKVDVEGHEGPAIAGMQMLLSKNEVVLQIERYADDDVLSNTLSRLNLRHLCGIGADGYYTNMTTSDRDIITVFESASEALVSSNLAVYFAEEQPLQVRLGSQLSLQIRGSAAKAARSLQAKLKPGH